MFQKIETLIGKLLPFAPRIWSRQIMFWTGGILIALAAIIFADACQMGSAIFYKIIAESPYLSFVVTPLGFMLLVWVTRHYFAGAEGSGVTRAITAIDTPEISNRANLFSLRVTLGKLFLTALGLCVGTSVGPEGPTVQIGATIMHKLGNWIDMPKPPVQRTLILAGGAAGIAAAFNAPMAGIIFAIEELARSFEEKTSGTVITTVIVAGVVSMAVFGNYTYFGHTDVTLSLEQAWRPVLLCSLVGGIFGGGFTRFLLFFARGIKGRFGFFIQQRPVLFAGLCGLFIALLGLFSGNSIFGTGYNEARSLIEGTDTLPRSFGFMKILATIASYISGMPGGLFAPTLAAGAGIGSDIASWMPDIPKAAIVILGMVAYFTGVMQVPITAAVIVMEMTDDQSLTLPLMATSFLSYAVSKIVCPMPLYRTMAKEILARHTRKEDREEEKKEGEDQNQDSTLLREGTPPA